MFWPTKGRACMTTDQLMIDTALASWRQVVAQASDSFNSLTDDQFQHEVAPGKNRVLYLLGHLTAVNDAMLTILGLGDRLHPELDAMFIKNPTRNRLNILLSRARHVSYHMGQVALARNQQRAQTSRSETKNYA